MQVQVVLDELGRRRVEKRAESPEESVRLRREADLLEVAAHPGLVELLGFEDSAEALLCTAPVDGPGLEDGPALEPEEVAGLVAALASTLADLHGMGLVHAAVAPEHVLVDEEGRPVLCSLGYGGLAGERPTAVPMLTPPFADPSRTADDRLDPAMDVHGLGALVTHLLAPGDAAAGGRRTSAEALARLARRAMAPVRADRPTAREVADAVHDTMPAARLPRRGPEPVGIPPPDPLDARRRQRPLERWRQAEAPVVARRSSRRRVAMGIGAGSAVAVVALAVALMPAPRPDRLERADPAPTGTAPEPAGPAPTGTAQERAAERAPERAAPSTLPGRPGCTEVAGLLAADVDGDGCAEAVRFADGVIEAGASRWAVGAPGDVAAVGDWACNGARSLALLRPATGEVFTFDGWATAGQEAHAPLLARVGGGRGLRAADLDGDGCHELVVERINGAPAVLRPGGRP